MRWARTDRHGFVQGRVLARQTDDIGVAAGFNRCCQTNDGDVVFAVSFIVSFMVEDSRHFSTLRTVWMRFAALMQASDDGELGYVLSAVLKAMGGSENVPFILKKFTRSMGGEHLRSPTIRLPPQKCSPLCCRETSQGHEYGAASCPPTMRVRIGFTD